MGGNQSNDEDKEEDEDRKATEEISKNHAAWLKTPAGIKSTNDAETQKYNETEWMRKIQEEYPST